ncbi:major facilitator superfamily domain-containing protein [Xylariaceae sp. FL0255]|nr:major facilitator superfamily domain-containing protein [Xylariaceae sp. FL0255]
MILTDRHQVFSDSATPQPTAGAPALPHISRKKQIVILLSAFATIALTVGYNQCYGVFQEYYLSDDQDVLLSPRPATELCYGLTWGGGILVNPVISRIEHGFWTPPATSTTPSATTTYRRLWRRRLLRLLTLRSITVSSMVLMSAGFALTSLSTTLWHLLLTQGLLVGLGMSLLYHRATAMGFILAGGGAGGLISSPVIRALLSSIGGHWTLRVVAVFYLIAGLPTAWAVPRSRFAGHSSEGQRATHVSRSLAVHPTFIFSAVAAFLQAAGAQLPLAFIPSYTVVLGETASKGANLLAASNAINAVSRILTGYASDRLSRQNMVVMTLLLSGVSVFGSASSPLWLAFIALYSFSAGGYYGLFPALITEVFGIRQYAAVNAFILFVRGLGTVFGTPVGG